MIYNFPVPYADELFYSAAGRCAARYAFPSHKTLLQELFGVTTVVATIEFPSRLEGFMANLPSGHPCAGLHLLDRHTLLPWYAPFLPSDRLDRLQQAMLGNGGASASGLVGLQASRVRPPKMLRFCPECFRHDIATGRELHWRRLHQLTGVEVCPEHRVWLEDSTVPRWDRVTRHAFEPARWERQDVPPRGISSAEEPLLKVAQLGKQLLAGNWRSIGWDVLHVNLHSMLAEAGYATLRGRIKTRLLLDDARAFFPTEYLVRVNRTESMNWLERLVHVPRSLQAPIRYLMALAFLGANPDRLFQSSQPVTPVEPGPPCDIPVCPGRGKPTDLLKTVISADVGGPIGLFRCKACEAVIAECEVGHKRTWIRDYGRLWKQKLAQFWEDPEQSLRGIARVLEVDPLTVKRQAMKAGLRFPRRSVRPTTTRGLKRTRRASGVALPQVRQKWLSLRNKHPGLGITALRRKAPRTYMTLYRRDRTWLRANRPARVKRQAVATRADWAARDIGFCAAIGAVSLHLRYGRANHGQVTKTAIARTAGRLSWLHHLDKLPRSQKKLLRVVEDREEFACRRVRRLAYRCLIEGRCLEPWKFVVEAGLRPELQASPKVSAALEEASARLAFAPRG